MDVIETDNEEENFIGTNLLPEKSWYQNERAYNIFDEWRKENRIGSFSEDVMLAFFQKLSQNMNPTSLWSTYSMFRSTSNLKTNVDISKYNKLRGLFVSFVFFYLFIWS
jgi:hypothetical protein